MTLLFWQKTKKHNNESTTLDKQRFTNKYSHISYHLNNWWSNIMFMVHHTLIGLWCLTPRSTLFQLYWWRRLQYPEKTRPAASYWQTLSHNVVHLALSGSRTHNISGMVIGTDCIGSCKSNYHTITAMMAPFEMIIVKYI